ncbi:MAG: ABC transporter permease [Acetobacteraceae bacterium]|nr:ABC transporter permease [Acetobacteraceae bacterium]
MTFSARNRMAMRDIHEGMRKLWLAAILGWLDIRLRYRGSMLGPFWLTLSTAVMVGALGFLYAALFKMELHDYLPYLALSLVLWNFLASLVAEGCAAFTESEAMIRSHRMPYLVYALRVAIRNTLVFAHNFVVIAVVFAIFEIRPHMTALLVLPASLLWAVDAVAIILLLGAFCARFRDIPLIVASVMQIAFFLTPIIWKPELLGDGAKYLPFSPFYALFDLVRAPLLGEVPSPTTWASAIAYSALLCAASWAVFVRVRGRIAFWV